MSLHGKGCDSGDLRKDLGLGAVVAVAPAPHSQTGENSGGRHVTRERAFLLEAAQSPVSLCLDSGLGAYERTWGPGGDLHLEIWDAIAGEDE